MTDPQAPEATEPADPAEAPVTRSHQERMARLKRGIDKRIAAADRDEGVMLVVTGNGKAKSSSGFGMVARALGHGMKVAVIQFIKGRGTTGEEAFFRRFPDEVHYHVMGEGFTWETQDRERDTAKAHEAWAMARRYLQDPGFQLVLLDEVNIALKHGYLDVQTVLDDLMARPDLQHVVLTGRHALPEIIAAAHTVSDVQMVKHAFKQGIRAQKGLEW